MDGWEPAELALASWNTAIWIKEFYKMIEAGSPWPKSCLHAMVRYLEKEGSKVGDAMSFRPLTVTVPIYRRWAATRLRAMQAWIEGWALEEMFAGVPGQGAVDAWYQVLMDIELKMLEGTPFLRMGQRTYTNCSTRFSGNWCTKLRKWLECRKAYFGHTKTS